MVKIRNTDAANSLKVIEILQKETILAPGQELETELNVVEVQVEIST